MAGSSGRQGVTNRRGDGASVAGRGIAGSTFDQVAREAGVSRGLLHYYFGPADVLRAKRRAGVLVMRADPEAVSAFLFTLADGVTVRRLSEPGFDTRAVLGHAVQVARALLS